MAVYSYFLKPKPSHHLTATHLGFKNLQKMLVDVQQTQCDFLHTGDFNMKKNIDTQGHSFDTKS